MTPTHSFSVAAFAALLLFSNSVLAGLALSHDTKAGCAVYRVTSTEQPLLKTETLISEAYVSGFALRNAAVDFDSRAVRLEIVAIVRFGFNERPAGTATWISASQTNFSTILNSLNRTVFLYSKACVAPSGQILWIE